MKTYQIYIDSAAGTLRPDYGGAVVNYKFDWGILPEGEYEMSFSFMSRLEKLTNAEAEVNTYPIQLEIDIPFSGNNFKVRGNDGFIGYGGATQVTGLLEVKDQHKTGTHTMRLLVSDTNLNKPISLYGKPQGMDFSVSLFAHGGVYAVNSPLYNMVIFLKHIC
mgnify:CR=1 FL=1|tara:strand:- start:3400 stop:3888 length:489 start_codon:yes stop_codon:yes gene_type:complete